MVWMVWMIWLKWNCLESTTLQDWCRFENLNQHRNPDCDTNIKMKDESVEDFNWNQIPLDCNFCIDSQKLKANGHDWVCFENFEKSWRSRITKTNWWYQYQYEYHWTG
jgi:hypothetical protein